MKPDASAYWYGAYTPEEYEDRWLRFETDHRPGRVPGALRARLLRGLPGRATPEPERRVARMVDRDVQGPAVDLGICIAWPDKVTFPETISRGRKQHHVRILLGASHVQNTSEADRKKLLVPTVEEALRRLIARLKLAPPPPFPDGMLSDAA